MKKFVIALMAVMMVAGIAVAKDKAREGMLDRVSIDCTTATPIACEDVVASTNVGGTQLFDAYGCGFSNQTGPEVFFTFTLDADAEVTASLTDMEADLDIFLGVCGDDVDCLAGANSTFTIELLAGDYYIAVDGYNGAESPFTLTLECADIVPPQPGETCDTAIELIDDDLVNTCPGAEFWYVYTAPFDGFIMLDTCIEGQSVDTYIRVYDACDGTQLAFNDDATCEFYNYASYLEVPMVEGQVMYIMFDDNYSSASFDFNLFVSDGVVATDAASFGSIKSMYR